MGDVVTPSEQLQEPADRLSRIRTDPGVISGDPEDLVSIDWSVEWDEVEHGQP